MRGYGQYINIWYMYLYKYPAQIWEGGGYMKLRTSTIEGGELDMCYVYIRLKSVI